MAQLAAGASNDVVDHVASLVRFLAFSWIRVVTVLPPGAGQTEKTGTLPAVPGLSPWISSRELKDRESVEPAGKVPAGMVCSTPAQPFEEPCGRAPSQTPSRIVPPLPRLITVQPSG